MATMGILPSQQTPRPEPHEADYILPDGIAREQFYAMGTTITLLVPEQQRSEGLEIVQTLFAEWEQVLSRFLPRSELSRLNRRAGQNVVVSELLLNVLREALTAAQVTCGIYDPTLLVQLVQVGYDRSFDELPATIPESRYCGLPGGGWRSIQVDWANRHVRLPRGVQLDFGGIAKGMAVDAALERLRQAGIHRVLVNAGGDLRACEPPPGRDSWSIALSDLERTWTIPLHHGAIATSGVAHRHWKQGNITRHHLLDPRTGLPVDNGLWSVTVVTEHCGGAEIAAKTAFILGRDFGKTFLQQCHLAGFFVSDDGTYEAVGEWPEHLMRELV